MVGHPKGARNDTKVYGVRCQSMIRKNGSPVFPHDKREAFARISCLNDKVERDADWKKSHLALKPTTSTTGPTGLRLIRRAAVLLGSRTGPPAGPCCCPSWIGWSRLALPRRNVR